MNFKPRPYQQAIHDAIFKEWESVTSTLVVAPTGTGKTCIFAMVCKTVQPKRAMVIAHREELIWQARDKIQNVTGLDCGIEMADNFVNNSLFGDMPVIISTIQTQNSNNGDRKRMGRFDPKEFGVLIVDESHHSTADSYKNLINYYKTNNPDIKVLGVTATPDRSDEEALGQIFESVAFDYEILDAIHDGYLVPIDQQFVTISGLDFSHMRTTAGDLNGSDLAETMENEKNLQGVAGAALEIIGSRRTIVFTASVKQAEELCNIFNRHRAGMAAWVCGKTPKDDRRDILKQFQWAKTQIICNCGVLTEGFDDPGVEVIVMARPTKSRSLYAQMAGRSTRPLPDLVDGLEDADARKVAIRSSNKPSCIAEGELVLTDAGLVPIQEVTTSMKVWDGMEFVPHQGVICHGRKQVIEYAGLRATADHKVWTEEGWRSLGDCASEQTPISVAAFSGQAIREADGYFRGGNSSWKSPMEGLSNDQMRLRSGGGQGLCKSEVWKCWLPSLRSTQEGSGAEVALHEMRLSQESVHQSELHELQVVWREGNTVQVLKPSGYGALDKGEHWPEVGHDHRPHGQQWELRAGKPKVVNTVRAGQEFADVYDILNCGHRNRFTVSGLLVHNCLIVDFVGNSGRHKLMTSADILGGKVSDEAIDSAVMKAKKNGKPVRMSELLDEEEAGLQEKARKRRLDEEARKAKLVAKVSYNKVTINPFDVFHLKPEKARGWDNGRSLSEKQKKMLLGQGVNPDSLPYAQGRQLLNEIFRRLNKKLCNMKQARVLQRFGYQTDNMTFKEALSLCDSLARNGWRRPAAPIAAPVAVNTTTTADEERSPF